MISFSINNFDNWLGKWYLRVLQLCPTHPLGQMHMLGLTHRPPFMHPPSQIGIWHRLPVYPSGQSVQRPASLHRAPFRQGVADEHWMGTRRSQWRPAKPFAQRHRRLGPPHWPPLRHPHDSPKKKRENCKN